MRRPRFVSMLLAALLATVITPAVNPLSMAPAFAADDSRPATRPDKATPGKPAPDFELVDLDGTKRSLSSYRGRIVVLDWTDPNPRCLHVDRLYRSGAMQRTVRETKAVDDTVLWLSICSDPTQTAEKLKLWVGSKDIKHPVLLDPAGKVARLYDARVAPHMFVIDKEGVLRYHGAVDDSRLLDKPGENTTNYVLDAVKALAKGVPVEKEHVAPLGCRIRSRR